MEWRVAEFLGIKFEVSNTGLVKRDGVAVTPNGSKNPNSYLCIPLYRAGKGYVVGVHRLVALAFFGEPKDQWTVVDHLDGNKQNNNVENLEYVSCSENIRRAIAMKRARGGRPFDSVCRFKDEEVLEIFADYISKRMTMMELAEKYKCSFSTMRNIINRKSYKWVDTSKVEIQVSIKK